VDEEGEEGRDQVNSDRERRCKDEMKKTVEGEE